MAQTTFTSKKTSVKADWANEVDNLVHGVFNNPTMEQISLATNGDFRLGLSASPALFLDVSAYQLQVGKNLTTENAHIVVGKSRAGNGASLIDFSGDATYEDGLRIRRNGGVNASSELKHRGTGNFFIETTEAAPIILQTNNITALTIDSSQNIILNHSTEDLKFVDSGSASATEQDWVEVTVGGNTGYIRVFAAK